MEGEIDYYKYSKKKREANAFKKLFSYVDYLEKNTSFSKEMREIRAELGIPLDGLPLPEVEEQYGILKMDKRCGSNQTPENENQREIRKQISNINKKYKLHLFGEAIYFYIFYNDLTPLKQFGFVDYADCIDLEDYFSDGLNEKNIMLGVLENHSKTNPIAILIHPYMTQNDITDFIKKMYKVGIKPIQDKYKDTSIPLGITRQKSKKILERNKFIYENSHKSNKEIMSLVNHKFNELLEYTYIDKIIREEKKKRGK